MEMTTVYWVGFTIAMLVITFVDLFIQGKKEEEMSLKESLGWTALWIALALAFNGMLYFTHGPQAAIEFLTGYLVEKSLSLDNLFVFMLIFSYFHTPKKHVHKVLFYGILGALIMRAIFIFGGIALVENFHWVLYILAVFLIVIGVKMFFKSEHEIHPEKNPLLILMRKFVPLTNEYREGKFFVKEQGKKFATPLFVTLVAVETTDLVFAIDSIPAILAITRDPFIVYTSNILAILGLRSLYFALSAFISLFHYLHYALGAILTFVGVKMLIADFYKIPTIASLGFILIAMVIAVIFSLMFPKRPLPRERS